MWLKATPRVFGPSCVRHNHVLKCQEPIKSVISAHEPCVFIKNPFRLNTKRIVCLGKLPRWFTEAHCGPDQRLIDDEAVLSPVNPKCNRTNRFVNPNAATHHLMGISEAFGPSRAPYHLIGRRIGRSGRMTSAYSKLFTCQQNGRMDEGERRGQTKEKDVATVAGIQRRSMA